MAGPWQLATVVDVRPETTSAVAIRLRPERPFAYSAGQHVVVRLTAPDGYSASRAYSIATAPPLDPARDPAFELVVQRLADGEVSPFLCDDLLVGDTLEVRGPIGGFFVWEPGVPVVLVGGGSGVVPLMAMLRAARRAAFADAHLVVSARNREELMFATELLDRSDATVAYSRADGPGGRRAGRLVAGDLAAVPAGPRAAFVCGGSGFADHAARLLIEHGLAAADIRIERFGPS